LNTALHLFDFSFGSPPADLAYDEALLEGCESGRIDTPGILRFWEPTSSYVVLGYANRVSQEVKSEKLPVFRRCSGGGSVLQAPGCMNYSLILPVALNSALESVTQTNCLVMKRNAEAVSALIAEPVRIEGHTDLTWRSRKFSGNSQRRKHHWLLFHGSFLLKADFALMGEVLAEPLQQPAYRKHRAHADFLTCLPCTASELKLAVSRIWQAEAPFQEVPRTDLDRLIREKYATDAWNFKW